jgi:hypothetical protein
MLQEKEEVISEQKKWKEAKRPNRASVAHLSNRNPLLSSSSLYGKNRSGAMYST